MRIAINTLPLQTGHRKRGIGYYTNNLVQGLEQDASIELQKFSNLSEVKDADVVHYPWFDFFFHTLKIRKNLPTVVTIHDVIPLIFPENYPVGLKGRLNFMLQKISLRRCKFIITDSRVSKEDIIKYLKIEEKKVVVVHLAADPKFKIVENDTELIHVKRKYNLPDKFLLYVGDANWVKNLPFLVEGFHELIKKSDFKDIKLVLVGGVFLKDVENIDHPELKSLKLVNKLIKQYGLEENIIRPGQIEDDDLVAFYNLATIYVQPSLYEGFGLPVLQAFACGAPVLSSNKGSLPEIGGDSAVYFDPANKDQFVTIATGLLENRSLRSKLSRLGLQQASKFSWEKAVKETKDIYTAAAKK